MTHTEREDAVMKILIVEDEFNAREGLASIIEKTCPQHEICGKAADGEEGCRLALERRPDLIFVDIELPKMNGLKMIEKLADRSLNAAFVILSGYAEFEYAQRAIRYGVSEYLLKPITYDKLVHVIESMEKWKHAASVRQKKEIPPEELLASVLSGRSDAKEAMSLLKSMVPPRNLYLLNLYFGSRSSREELEKIQTHLCAFCGGRKYELVCRSVFPRRRFLTALVGSGENQADMERSVNYHLSHALRRDGFPNVTISLLRLGSPGELPGSLERLAALNEWGLTLGNRRVLTERGIPPEDEASGGNGDSIRQINMEALSVIKSGEPQKLTELNRRLLDFLERESCPPREFRNACAQYALSVLVCFREFNVDAVEKIQKMQLFDGIRSCFTQEEMLGCLDRLVSIYRAFLPDQVRTSSILVRKTIDYIARSYADRVSLEEIAATLKVTPEYVSHLFTREIGISFSDYVKKYRIDMAKKIMQTSHYKMYQVGEKVGYRDPKYFNKMFKEVTGLSPKEYMKKG